MKKYNKSKVLKRAWKLYKLGAGNFSECLKRSWFVEKTALKCGKIWEPDEQCRVYLNQDMLMDILGVKIEHFQNKAQTIKCGYIGEKEISKNACRQYLSATSGCYYNALTDKFGFNTFNLSQFFINEVKAVVQNLFPDKF